MAHGLSYVISLTPNTKMTKHGNICTFRWNPSITGWSFHRGPVIMCFHVYFAASPNLLLNKRVSYLWLYTSWRSHHCYANFASEDSTCEDILSCRVETDLVWIRYFILPLGTWWILVWDHPMFLEDPSISVSIGFSPWPICSFAEPPIWPHG